MTIVEVQVFTNDTFCNTDLTLEVQCLDDKQVKCDESSLFYTVSKSDEKVDVWMITIMTESESNLGEYTLTVTALEQTRDLQSPLKQLTIQIIDGCASQELQLSELPFTEISHDITAQPDTFNLTISKSLDACPPYETDLIVECVSDACSESTVLEITNVNEDGSYQLQIYAENETDVDSYDY